MKNKSQKFICEGLKRIDEIKSSIASCKRPRLCKAQVYEMWESYDLPAQTER